MVNYASGVVRALTHLGLRKYAFSTLSRVLLQCARTVETVDRTKKGFVAGEGYFLLFLLIVLGVPGQEEGKTVRTLPTRIAGAASGNGPSSLGSRFST